MVVVVIWTTYLCCLCATPLADIPPFPAPWEDVPFPSHLLPGQSISNVGTHSGWCRDEGLQWGGHNPAHLSNQHTLGHEALWPRKQRLHTMLGGHGCTLGPEQSPPHTFGLSGSRE